MFKIGFERYAKKVGADLVVVKDFIIPSDKRAWWQKLVPFEDPKIAQYDKVAVIDYDIYIPKHAKNVFEAVGSKPWGICKSNPYNLPENAITDMRYFDGCPKENRPPFAANGGMMVLSKSYKDKLKEVYDEYSETEPRDMEAGPLFYFLYNDGKGTILDHEFNTPVALYVKKYGCSLSAILRMYDGSSFIHFVGGKWHSIHFFIRWFDNTKSNLARKVIRFLGSKRFDPVTSFMFKMFQRLLGIYNYRIKRFVDSSGLKKIFKTTNNSTASRIDLRLTKLIREKSLNYLSDANLVEKELIPQLGLNNEKTALFPRELSRFFGKGLFIWQYPNQFSRYLAQLSKFKIQSYMEIGVRHGGTFVTTVEYLNKFNPIKEAVAVDINDCPSASEYARLDPHISFLKADTTSDLFKRFVKNHSGFDLVLIDGDHSDAGCRNDFEIVKDKAKILAFHDIEPNAAPGVAKIWNEFKEAKKSDYLFFEFRDQYESVSGKWLGIGLAVKKDMPKN